MTPEKPLLHGPSLEGSAEAIAANQAKLDDYSHALQQYYDIQYQIGLKLARKVLIQQPALYLLAQEAQDLGLYDTERTSEKAT